MKKAVFLLMLCVAISVAIHAQGFDWVRSYTGQDYSSLETNKIVSSCADSDGNLYILGKFSPQASLCGVALLPSGIESIVTNPHFAANSGYGGVVIAKISPEGNLLWNKALFCTGNGMALDLRGIGDSAIMVMATIVLPFYQDNILQYNRLYYLDTLLAASNEDYLMPTDSMNSYNVNAFITIRNDGEVIEQHFLYVGLEDTNGQVLRQDSGPLSREFFDLDSQGNIYVVRQSYDNYARYSISDGTIGAVRILVDGVRTLKYRPDRRSATWNQQILKFSPHFDSLIAGVYLLDSTDVTPSEPLYPTLDVSQFNVDSQGNVFVHLAGHGIFSPCKVSNSDSLDMDLRGSNPRFMVKFDSNFQAKGMAQLSYDGESPEEVVLSIPYSCIDESTHSIFLSGRGEWSRYSTINGVFYNDTVSLDISRNDAFWLRLDMDSFELLSFGKARAGEWGTVYEPRLATQQNRVFAQTQFSKSIIFDDVTATTPSTGQKNSVFVIWDYDGNELFMVDYHSFYADNIYNSPVVVDSIVYLTGTLHAAASFGNSSTPSTGNSYAYIAKYIDTAFSTPYDTTHTDPVDTSDVRITVLGDEGAFVVYPNPFRQRVDIRIENSVATAWLTDLQGRREKVTLTSIGDGHYSLDLIATQTFKHSRNQAILLTLVTADGHRYTLRLLPLNP